MRTAAIVLLTAIGSSAATITIDLHQFGPASFLDNAGNPFGYTLQLTDTPVSIDLALNGSPATIDFGKAILGINNPMPDVGSLTASFIFDVAKTPGSPVTHGISEPFGAISNPGAPNDKLFSADYTQFPAGPSFFDFGDGTSLSLGIPTAPRNPQTPYFNPPTTVDMFAYVLYFPTAQGGPIPEPSSLGLLLLGGIALAIGGVRCR